ncbi:SDR family oxidoreductase [Granulicella arctica]|uniref:SDR family oxidoreductase n=1 Tax=Granulicella arctica TaxID=940613 RepID=UPI0021E0B247|nr:SDR family oxidoreductase [Granulicella arctica]
MALYLITGAAGFIGSHLVHTLIQRGDDVRALDNFSTGRRENLANLEKQLDLREVDLRDSIGVLNACVGVDFILHQGALPSVPRSVSEPRPSHETNIDGTFNLLEGARAAGVKRIVYAASSSAYGNQPGFPRVESMKPQPIAPYPVQKLAGELYMQSYWQVYGLETVCLRYFNIFGPRQVADSPYSGVMARFILQMMRGEQPVINGDGEQGRDFTYVENAVQANLRACAASAEKVAGRVFNVACGERHTLNETYEILARLLGYPHPPQYGPDRAGDVRDSLADISAAHKAMNYVPHIGFEEGLRRTVEWYQAEFSASFHKQDGAT